MSHIAKLANLPLSQKEKELFAAQLDETLFAISNINEVATIDTKETSRVIGLSNITRDDTPVPSLSQDDALKNAKSTYNGLFKVKAILEE